MLTDDGKHLYVSWEEYHQLIERLALKVHASGWEFDQSLCLARGGLRPGDIISRIFDRPLGIMSISSYRDDGGTLQEFFFHAVVYDKVYITLTVAQFGVLERVVSHTILIFHDRQGLDALCKYGQLLGMDADFAHLGTEYESFDTDEVA